MPSLRRTRFMEFLVKENALDDRGFREWFFRPGMLFHSPVKWWGDMGKRHKPHEGIDLLFFRDYRDNILHLGIDTRIPAMYDGVVVAVFNDFLGRSLILEHGFPGNPDMRFHTIYGHTKPHRAMHVGRLVQEGDILATLSNGRPSDTDIPPHLHLSIGWTAEQIAYGSIDWDAIGDRDALRLMNPLHVLEGPYLELENAASA